MVLQTVRDEALAIEVHALARREGFLFCAIDQPAHADFSHPAIAEAGPVQVAVSTNGTAPSLARRIREDLEQALDARFAEFAAEIARVRAAGAGDPDRRRARVEAALAGFALEVSVRYPSGATTVNRNHQE
jgi:uroporphyrin-III C-methyltransferase / precorrin-2 dehydrogenase / sirohydrochlorin ferrochelatase